jgi:hypothetical protein
MHKLSIIISVYDNGGLYSSYYAGLMLDGYCWRLEGYACPCITHDTDLKHEGAMGNVLEEIINLSSYLVQIKHRSGFYWQSSKPSKTPRMQGYWSFGQVDAWSKQPHEVGVSSVIAHLDPVWKCMRGIVAHWNLFEISPVLGGRIPSLAAILC